MRTSALAQGPLGLGGEYIIIGNTIYNIESPADYANATGPLKAFLDARAAREAAENEFRRAQDRLQVRFFAKGAGAPMVSVLQMRLAALAHGRLTGLDAAIAALPANEFKVRWQEGDHFTRVDLDFLVPGTLTLAQADALFASAQQQ